jgi:hypothetical protein
VSRLTPPKSSRRPGVACRSQERRSAFRYVRQVRGRSGIWVWQARAWLPLPIGSVNLGCYREERIAWEAVKRWIRSGADPVRDLPAGVLPKWVRRERDAGGRATGRYVAEFRSGSGRRDRLGVYKTPHEAFEAALGEAQRQEEGIPPGWAGWRAPWRSPGFEAVVH